jgi:hypothetical protein
MNLFRSKAPADATVDGAPSDGAYVKGQRDAHVADRAVINERNTAVRQAYDRGRRDERARRPRRHSAPFFTFIVLAAALVGVGAIYLGVSQGSFGRGGQVVDQKLAGVAQPATQATRSAADRAADALQNAGQRIKQTAGDTNTASSGG